ncbi:MAG: glycosyltransferase [bacterium]|nr:glycosyltransferase [bacterium]
MAERVASKRAVVVGFEYYARRLARLITRDAPGWQARAFGGGYIEKLRSVVAAASADAIISFGGPGPDGALVEIARRRGIPILVIWAGSDVVALGEDPGLLHTVRQYDFEHVSDGPWLVDELRALGLTARYLPVTAVEEDAPLEAMPTTFGVLSYLPEQRRAFYGEEAVHEIARAFPETPFTIVGTSRPAPNAPSNVRYLGRVASERMRAIVDASSVLLRLPSHDGKSQLVLETLARGRHVVWTYPFPGVVTVASSGEAQEAIAALLERHRQGTLTCNDLGRAYAIENFAPRRLACSLATTLDELCARPPRRASRSRVVAISGVTLFSAQVAQEVRASSLDWEPHLLRAGRKNERLASLIALMGADVWYTVGSPIPDRLLHAAATLLRKPRVVHWVGSDILSIADRKDVARLCKRRDVLNLAEAQWTVDELRERQVRATIAPLPPRVAAPNEPPPLPRYFTVLAYLPRSRDAFYGRDAYERLIATFARRPVRFLIVGGGSLSVADGADVTHLGWSENLAEVYARTSVLVRLTEHDGLALMALEALAFGRYVLWSRPFAYAQPVESIDACVARLSELLGAHLCGQLEPQRDVASAIQHDFERERCIATIAGAWEHAAGKRS